MIMNEENTDLAWSNRQRKKGFNDMNYNLFSKLMMKDIEANGRCRTKVNYYISSLLDIKIY